MTKWTPQQPLTAKGDPASRQFLEYLQGLGGGGATDLGYTAATRALTSSTGAGVTLPLAGADPGLMSAADKTKLDGLQTGTFFYGILASNYTLTSTTAVQKLFDWSANGALTLDTGVYVFECAFQIASMSATTGNGRFDLTGGGTATVGRVLQAASGRERPILNANPTPLSGAVVSSNVFTTNTVQTDTDTTMEAVITGSFDVTATGTIIPSILLTTAAAAVVQAGSRFICQRVGDTGTTTNGTWT